MDKFIQKILACSNIQVNSNLVQAFPIISLNYQNKNRLFLLFQFVNNGIPNYIVLGMFEENIPLDRESLLLWLRNLCDLIMCRSGYQEKEDKLETFKNSSYFNQILFSQEGFDIINGKQYFTSGGLISRTIIVPCHVCDDRTIEFKNEIVTEEYNQFLDGDFFRKYEDYEQNYFLNFQEYHTMSYLNVLEYVKLNYKRLAKKENLNVDDQRDNLEYFVQLLDSYIAQGLSSNLDDGVKRH